MNEPLLALRQIPLRRYAGKLTRENWVALGCEDDLPPLRVTLAQVVRDELKQGSWWIVGYRMREWLERSNWLADLDEGFIKLPTKRGKDGRTRRVGKITVTPSCLEIDLVCGRCRLKLLDFLNWQIDHRDYDDHPLCASMPKSEVMLRDWLQYAKRHRITTTKTTIAQAGWHKAKSLLPSRGCSVNLDDDDRALERRAYFGGRCEPFRLGRMPGLGFSFDIKGCYAQVCRMMQLPYHLLYRYPDGLPVDDQRLASGNHFIADVVIETESPYYPLRWGGQPIYPIGTFATSLCWPELAHALDQGNVKRIVRAAEYLAGPVLQDYAAWYQKQKTLIECGPHNRLKGALKALFNRSLGFTARMQREWIPWECGLGHRHWFGVTNSPDDHLTAVRAQIVGGQSEWLRVGGEPREAVPYLHASICSSGRGWLLKIMQLAGRENVWYVDTDGLLVSHAGRERLLAVPGLVGDKPGQLCQRWEPGAVVIKGQKNYRIGKRVVCSGLEEWRHNQWDTTGATIMVDSQAADGDDCKQVRQRVSLTTPCGQVDSHGVVYPHAFDCDEEGGECERWRNVCQSAT